MSIDQTCGTYTNLIYKGVLPFLDEKTLNALHANQKFHLRLRSRTRSNYCLDSICILPSFETTQRRVFGIVYNPIGRDFVDLQVQIDPETQNPLDVQLVRRFPLPPRLQMSGLLKMTSFHNASGEIIIVFGDRSGAGMFTPYRSNFNEGAIWITKYSERGNVLEIISLTSRFFGRKPKEMFLIDRDLFVQVNDDDWILWNIVEETDPCGEHHMQYILGNLFGVSAEDCCGYLAPNVKGEIDEEFFRNLPILATPVFYESEWKSENEIEMFNLGFENLEFTIHDALPHCIFAELDLSGDLQSFYNYKGSRI